VSAEPIQFLVATFPNEEGAARAFATLAPALAPDGIRQAAIVTVQEGGKAKFVETHDSTTGQGALKGAGIGALGGLVGILFTPLALLGLPLGAGVGALVGKLRDTGYEDEDLKALGADLSPGQSALVANVAGTSIDKAQRLLEELDAERVLVKEIGADLAQVLDDEVAAAGAGQTS
jgi:uncharacterized membrane protein